MKPATEYACGWLLLVAQILAYLGLMWLLTPPEPAYSETICAEITEHNQIPIWSYHDEVWLDCESAQWLQGMDPVAHLGPVFPDGPGTPARFMDPPTCTHGGDGFDRDTNGDLWIHDHTEDRPPLTESVPDPSYHFQCPDVANPNWNKYQRKTHTYNTNEGRILQGRNGAWCVEEPELGNFCNPDTISGVLTHQQHRGPLLCQIKIPTKGGQVTVHSGCDWEGCSGQHGVQRVRTFDEFGRFEILGLFPAGHPKLNTVSWDNHIPFIHLDGIMNTTWVGMKQLCVEVGCAPSPDFDGDGAVMVADFVNGFLPLYETGECSTSDFVKWFLPAFRAEGGN